MQKDAGIIALAKVKYSFLYSKLTLCKRCRFKSELFKQILVKMIYLLEKYFVMVLPVSYVYQTVQHLISSHIKRSCSLVFFEELMGKIPGNILEIIFRIFQNPSLNEIMFQLLLNSDQRIWQVA